MQIMSGGLAGVILFIKYFFELLVLYIFIFPLFVVIYMATFSDDEPFKFFEWWYSPISVTQYSCRDVQSGEISLLRLQYAPIISGEGLAYMQTSDGEWRSVVSLTDEIFSHYKITFEGDYLRIKESVKLHINDQIYYDFNENTGDLMSLFDHQICNGGERVWFEGTYY